MSRAVLFSVLLAGVSAGAAAAAINDADREFARPHQMVDIGGRRLNLYCAGSGPVTVVFDAPSGDAGWSWHGVQPKVAARTRACVYDRAARGFSDPSPLPPTFGNAASDLHALLAKAGIAPPYVLVGNSFGGAVAQLYAYRYPQDVKALVLVEAGHEDEEKRINAASQGKLKQLYEGQNQFIAQCAEAARKGFELGSDLFAACTGGTGTEYGRELAAARLAMVRQPAYWDDLVAGNKAGDASEAELRAARRSFGDLPLVVLVRGVSPYAVPGKPQSALNKATEAENLAIQKDIAALSTRSSLHIVAGASHIIQADKPQAVVDAVNEALDRAGY
ncbi:Pimeloyl-ACP methyl ester carboxylesterase [Massilia sp. PDC64]|nr:alpha/beta hydrolase [Massilia sp. PDC64]SDD35905.1 Pimeloyl-ACP methyl ester carboxylesterase [Massilia sp. PDC64]